jgi:hypothetical protein
VTGKYYSSKVISWGTLGFPETKEEEDRESVKHLFYVARK